MQVRKFNSHQLILFKPLKPNWRNLYFTFLCTIFTLLGAFFVGSDSGLVCQKISPNQGSCELIQSPFWIKVKQKFKLSDLREAKIKKSDKADGQTGKYSYHIVLLIKNTEVPLNFSEGTNEDINATLNKVVTRINQYIATPEIKKLNILQNQFSSWLLGSIPLFAFNIVFIVCEIYEAGSNCIFDRDTNYFRLTRKKWLRCIDVIEYPLGKISEVEIEICDYAMGQSHRITLKLDSGQLVPLTQDYYSDDYQEIVSNVRKFLNLS
ncbi:hypothetical protein [Nostoc sp. C117]|uniref:hypothetical protein n=1 Tax=Nostoc sp. C117 TaxID=3349875 RepID=UPI00370D0C8D